MRGLLLASVALFLLPARLPAGPPVQAGASISIRRVYAPADRMNQWPLGQQRYLPIEAAEFERLLTSARSAGAGPEAALAVRLASAEYRARLEGEQLVEATAELQVETTQAAGGVLALGSCNLAISQPVWLAPKPGPALVGLGAGGGLGVAVDRPGKLGFHWSHHGRTDEAGSTHFLVHLPPCPVSRLLLDLPDGAACIADRGIIGRTTGVPAGLARWRIDLGGQVRVQISITPAGARRTASLVQVRQTSVYDFSLHGADVAVQLALEIPSQPLAKLSLAVDPGLELLAARCGDRPLEWSVAPDAAGQGNRLELSFPEAVAGSQVVRLTALAPLVTDRPWRLPRLRPQGVYWQQGNTTLLVPQALVVSRLLCDGCRQSGIGPLAAPRSGESLQIECFAPDGTAEVVLQKRKPRLAVSSALALEMGGGVVKGQLTADLRVSDGELFALAPEIGRNWIINGVECSPADVLEDWSLTEARQRLSLTFAKALTPTRPLRLKITARRLTGTLGRALALEELTPLRLASAAQSRSLVAVSVGGPFDLKLTGDEQLARLDPRALEPRDQELLGAAARELVFLDDANAVGLSLALERKRPGYSAAIAVEATVRGNLLEETYRARCVPESAPVERLLVHFSSHRESPIRWTLPGQSEDLLDARRWSAEEQTAAGLAPGEEAWEIVLQRPTAETFEIHGTRRSVLSGQQGVSLASLPEAANQQGAVDVRSAGAQDLRIRNQLLAPLPLAGTARKSPPVRASFRYDPDRHVTGLVQPALSVGFAEQPGTAGNWVWDCQLQSRYQADGSGLHLAAYQIQNQGVGRIRLALPPGVGREQIRGAWLHETPVSWSTAEGDPQRIQIELAPGDRLVTLCLQFTTAGPPLALRGSLSAPLPRPETPLLAGHWIAWLPPGYEALRPAGSPASGIARRLFGALARADDQGPWHPLGATDLPIAPGYRAARANGRQMADQLVAGLDAAMRAAPAGLRWGKLLEEATKSTAPMLVDATGIALAGVGPLTPVRAAGDVSAADRATAALAAQNLTVLVHDDALVFTSQAAAGMQAAALHAAGPWPLRWVAPGALADRIRAAVAGRSSDGLVPLDVWCRRSVSPSPPWSFPGLEGSQGADVSGWAACWAEIPAQGSLELTYLQRKPLQLLAWVTFFGLAGLCGIFAAHRAVLILAAGLTAAAALVAPEAYVPFASASFMAVLVALLIGWLRRKEVPLPAEHSSRSVEIPSTLSGAPLGLLLAVGLALAQAAAAKAQATVPTAAPAKTAPAAPAAATRYDVFVPIDDQQKPTGGKYFVPEELFNQLHRQSAAAEPPRQAMITAAEYEGSLDWQALPEGLTVGRVKAVFHLWVFEAGAKVRIPLARTAVEVVEAETTLDGRAIRPVWELDSGGLLVDAPGPGPCRLEMVFKPAVKASGAESGFDVPIPALPEARLEMAVPQDAPRLEFPSALGAVRRSEESGHWLVDLGPTSRLTAAWPAGARRGSGGNKIDVEELVWLKIQSNAVLIDVRFKYKVIEGQLRQLQLACDPRLRLLPLRAPGMTVTDAPAAPGRARVIQIELARPVTDQVVFDGTFLVSGTAPVGNLRLPLLESVGARRTKRCLGVSVDAGMGFEEQVPERLEAVSLPDFLDQWGGDIPPQLAYKLPPRSLWGMAIRPRRPQTVADQVLRLSFGSAGADVQFDAELVTTGGYCLQHRLAAPAGLAVDRLSVIQDGVERVSRWAADSDGSLWVFLGGPLSGKQLLTLRGRLPAPQRGAFALPNFQLLQAQVSSSAIEIFRRPAVSAKIAASAGLVERQSSASDQVHAELGRPVGAFLVDGDKRPTASIQLSPNVPVVQAAETIALVAADDGWHAEAEFHLDVKQGTVERLEIDAGPPAGPPYQLEPAERFHSVEQAGQKPRLVVDPADPIRGRYRLRVRSALAAAPGSPIRVPDVRLRGLPTTERTVLLPGKKDGKPLVWETLGLRPIAMPAALARGELVRRMESPTAYRVESEPLRASLRAADDPVTGGEIRQAEISICLQSDGTFHGLAALDVAAGTLRECPLELPGEYQLIQVYVAGQAVEPEPRAKNQWQVPLLLGRLPQSVEVLFSGRIGVEASPAALVAPRLGKLPVRQTLWRILAPERAEVSAAATVRWLAPLRAELLRLRGVMSTATIDTPSLGAEPEELYCWHRLYASRLARSRAAVDAALAEETWGGRDTGEPPEAIRADLAAAQQQQARLEQWLAANPSLAPSSQDASLGPELQFLWSETAQVGRTPVFGLSAGWLERVGIATQAETPAWSGTGQAVLACLITLAILGLLRVEPVGRWVGGSGYLLVGLAGVAWWFFLWPGFLGLALIAASTGLAFAERWQRRRRAGPAAISLQARGV